MNFVLAKYSAFDPAIEVRVFELGDSAIIFKVRGWVVTSDWWATRCYDVGTV